MILYYYYSEITGWAVEGWAFDVEVFSATLICTRAIFSRTFDRDLSYLIIIIARQYYAFLRIILQNYFYYLVNLSKPLNSRYLSPFKIGPARYKMAVNAPYITKTPFYTIRSARPKALRASSGLSRQKISLTHSHHLVGIQPKSTLVCPTYNKSLKNKSQLEYGPRSVLETAFIIIVNKPQEAWLAI